MPLVIGAVSDLLWFENLLVKALAKRPKTVIMSNYGFDLRVYGHERKEDIQ